MNEFNKLRNYEIIGVPIIMVIATVLAAMLSNFGIPAPNGMPFIRLSNISLFQISQYMFTSIVIYSAFEYLFIGYEYRNFFFAKAAASLAGPTIFIFLTYFFNTTIGYTDRSFYIATFFIGTTLAQYLSYFFLREGYYFRLMNAYGVLMVILLLLTFVSYSNAKYFSSPIFQPLNHYENSKNNNYY